MNNTERILEMLINNDESLQGTEYEGIYVSDYDSVVDVITYGIDAYFAQDIIDYNSEDDNALDNPIGTEQEKAEALAQYLEQLAKDLRNDYEI
jgi:hypothetical protein